MEFIKGKWYKNWKNSNEIAAKYDSHSVDYFYFSEYIVNYYNKPYQKYKGSWYNEPQLKECPLSEIQQYLPDGHPDKFVNKSETSPLPEKWYLEVTKSNLSYVSSKRAWSFYSIGYIHSCLNSNVPNYWFHNNKPLEGYTEITLEQFKEYVVKDVTSKKVEPEIPEYVECIELDSCLVLNKVYKVKSKTKWTPHYKNRCDTVYYLEDSKAVGAYFTSYFKPSTK